MAQLPDRNQPVQPGKTALLVVDVQNGTFNDDVAQSQPYFFQQAKDVVIPNIARLIAACRDADIEVIYTTMESLTHDGRDRGLDYKLSGFNFPKGCEGSQVIQQVQPDDDEIVIPKTSSSLFNSTNFEYILRNIGILQVMVTGFLTDQCVDHTIRDGADRGFLMVCVQDACTTQTPERHANALSAFKGYCRTAQTQALVAELALAAKN